MSSVDRTIKNPLLRETHRRQREALVAQFPELASCPNGNFLFLHKYLKECPQQFYTVAVYQQLLEWLHENDLTNRTQLQAYLSDHADEIDRALLHLEEINAYEWHDMPIDELGTNKKNGSPAKNFNNYEKIRFIDRRIHPTYLRLSEAVFRPILKMVAHFSRIDRSAGTDGLDLWTIVKELRGCSFDGTLQSYHHIVRNGVGHGGVTYLESAIRYRDKRGNEEEFPDSAVIGMCDDLLDTCNALALALSVFSIVRQTDGYLPPKQLLIEELRIETKSPFWEIVGCVPSESLKGSQLIVYARSLTLDPRKVHYSAFQSGVLAERFEPGFDRYFISINSDKSWPGFAAFDGKKLRLLRESERPLEDYGDVIEDNLVFYVPNYRLPALLGRIETILIGLNINARLAIADIRKQFGWTEIKVRNASIHQNSWGCVLNGKVVISETTPAVDQNTVRKLCGRIVSNALSCARKNSPRLVLSRYLPIGFAQISVFQRNYRRRHLSNFGFGADLICTIQVQRLARIQAPNFSGSTIEQHGKYRIIWNRAWMEEPEGH